MTETQFRVAMRFYCDELERGMADELANASPATKRFTERMIVVACYEMSELLKSHIKQQSQG